MRKLTSVFLICLLAVPLCANPWDELEQALTQAKESAENSSAELDTLRLLNQRLEATLENDGLLSQKRGKLLSESLSLLMKQKDISTELSISLDSLERSTRIRTVVMIAEGVVIAGLIYALIRIR